MSLEQTEILIVDDEPLNRELIRRVLQRSFEVAEAEDAVKALEFLQGRAQDQSIHSIRLILCDQLMPGKNGTDLAAEVFSSWPHIRFFLLTGYDEEPEVLNAVSSGHVHKVIAKPWRGSTLKSAIAEALEP